MLEADRTTVGRWETGNSDPKAVIRPRLARLLDVSLDELAGLLHRSEAAETEPQPDDHDDLDDEGDDMHRRQFLALAGHAFATLILNPSGTVEVTINPGDGLAPHSLVELTRAVDEIKRAFQDCHYDQVVDLVPAVLNQLHAADAVGTESERPQIAVLLTHTFHVASSVLLKLHAPAESRAVAEQAMAHAKRSEDPVAIGAASRIITHTLMAQGVHDEAKDYAATQAAVLDSAVARHSPDSLSIYGALLLRGAVAAAQSGDGDTARSLIDEADRAASQLGGDYNYQWTAVGPNNIIAHRIAIEVMLGNAGTAVDNYNRIQLDKLAITERKAIVHLDLAKAYTQWGKYDLAIDALQETEQLAPQELRRPQAQELIERIDSFAPASVRTDIAALTRRVAAQ